jgi:2-oxoglutarate ferredoxin oxidoreductase subunit alpha
MDVNVRIAGEAGQGVDTTGNVLAGAFGRLGLYVLASQDYMSRIRGGLNWFDIRVGDTPLFSGRHKTELLVALSQEALDKLQPTVSDAGIALFNGTEAQNALAIDFTGVAKEVGGSPIMANSVAAGAVFALLGYDAAPLCTHLAATLGKKGPKVVEANEQCVRKGYELARAGGKRLDAPEPSDAPPTVYSGGQAVGLAAATAGVKFVTAYPMSPSTATFTYLAAIADEYGIVVEQAEDEIAAINMICGAAYGGVPAMTTTSGGGFALMVEGFSLAGVAELPVVIMLGQRPGPATGLPTHTAQEDLKFVLNAGHGEFARAVFAPGTPAQAYELTRRALEIAHAYRTPAVILTDQYLADLLHTSPELDRTYRPIDRHLLVDPPPDYLSYAVTGSGVSPRALPGSGAVVVADSHEHTEDGHISEDPRVRTRMVAKRLTKLTGMAADVVQPELYGPERADSLLVCWGSTYGPCREAVDMLNAQGRSVACLHFAQVWPIDAPAARRVIGSVGAKRITCVEGNATGQFASVLHEQHVLDQYEFMLKSDSRPFTGEEIASRCEP